MYIFLAILGTFIIAAVAVVAWAIYIDKHEPDLKPTADVHIDDS